MLSSGLRALTLFGTKKCPKIPTVFSKTPFIFVPCIEQTKKIRTLLFYTIVSFLETGKRHSNSRATITLFRIISDPVGLTTIKFYTFFRKERPKTIHCPAVSPRIGHIRPYKAIFELGKDVLF